MKTLALVFELSAHDQWCWNAGRGRALSRKLIYSLGLYVFARQCMQITNDTCRYIKNRESNYTTKFAKHQPMQIPMKR